MPLNSANGNALQAASSLNSQKQTLITMLGWEYNADPEITKVPEPDLTVIDSFRSEEGRGEGHRDELYAV